MKSLVFSKSDGGKVELSVNAHIEMQRFIQNRFYKREAGGVLLGRYIRNSLDIVIDSVTIPMRGDCQKRNKFYRSQILHQKAIDQAWLKSGGTVTYLGEWHTHPENRPIPSEVDFKNWTDRLQQDIHNSNSLYFVILGVKSLGIWEGLDYGSFFKRMGEFYYRGERYVKNENSP